MAKRIARFEKVSWEQFSQDWIDTFGSEEPEKIREIYESVKLPRRATAKAPRSGRPRVALSTIPRRSRAARSPITRSSFRPRGTSLRTTRRATMARWSRLSSACPLPMWRSRLTRCVPFTASTPAPLALCISSSRRPARSSRP